MIRSPTLPTSALPRKVGLLGGTFNPIHRCHLTLAREVRDRLALDQVLFVPSGDPPHKLKIDLAPAEHRLAMVRLAIEGEPALSISELEVRRTGVSYSIDTIIQLEAEAGPNTDFYFCIGLDAFLELGSWRRAEDLLAACHFVVVSRPGVRFAQLSAMPLLPSCDATSLREIDRGHSDCVKVTLPSRRDLFLLNIAPCPVSASLIRERIHHGLGMEGLLPPPVEHYIIRERLYQERDNPTRFQG